MIQALADYEHESNAVKATVQSLEDTLAFSTDGTAQTLEPTSPTRPARCLVLSTPEGEPAGIALYFYNYSTWRSVGGIYLEDLFVRPAQRGKGYGKRLLVELARQVVEMKGARLEWSVLKWNEPSIKFYQSIGAKAMDEWVGMRVDNDGLDRLAHLLD
ncbi:Ribosomal protein S18 acetylase RimI [Geosmithia morbida]|uniref:Ribosomal protein S18 acetylase RimI n=1 Tax=Geosmithia morbida TaxID=1094350 RepID=A0A9P4YYL7_9HYPO|nr:Ribosomal protein S18 acetylase RimI [Geosmithia morbida]KAF4125481.1 Ribosomal protein S18 acetylase RimI [Geosmithia morbida]